MQLLMTIVAVQFEISVAGSQSCLEWFVFSFNQLRVTEMFSHISTIEVTEASAVSLTFGTEPFLTTWRLPSWRRTLCIFKECEFYVSTTLYYGSLTFLNLTVISWVSSNK